MNARWGVALFIGLPVVFLAVVAFLLRRGGDPLPAPDERVVSRVVSPDGRRTAVVAEISAVSPTVEGFIVRVGGEEAFSAFGASRLTVRWQDAATLDVVFSRARFTRLQRVAGLKVVAVGKVDP